MVAAFLTALPSVVWPGRPALGSSTTSGLVLVPLALGVLWLRLTLNAIGFLRLVLRPDAAPVAVPRPGHDIVGDADIEERRA